MATITDYFSKASSGGEADSATLTAAKSIGAGSITLSTTNGWDSTTPQHFKIYTTTTNSQGQTIVSPGSETTWKGLVSGTTVTNLSLRSGTDQVYPISAIVEVTPTSNWANDLAVGIGTSLDPDGTLKAGAVDNTGVLANSVVTDVKLASSSVTFAKLAANSTTLGHNRVIYASTIIPTSYTTYATVTNTSTGGVVELDYRTFLSDSNSGATRTGHMRVTCDNVAVTDSDVIWYTLNGQRTNWSDLVRHTPAAGSHTWKLEVSADTGSASSIQSATLSVKEVK